MAKVFKGIINLIFIIVIVLLLGYFVLRITNKVEIYTVKTGSMEDKIHVGDYILIYRKDSYNVGDVVTFMTDGGFVTHRIIKKEGRTITTKGDANNTIDDVIKESIIVGKVILSGGILNIIIDYKFAFVGLLLSLYLISCYIGDGDDLEEVKDELEMKDDDNKNESEKQEASDSNNETEVENKKGKDESLIDETLKEKETLEDSQEKINQMVEKKSLEAEEITVEEKGEVKGISSDELAKETMLDDKLEEHQDNILEEQNEVPNKEDSSKEKAVKN